MTVQPAMAGPLAKARPGADRSATGILLLLGAVVCFAGIDGTAKWVNRTTDPMLTAAIRYLGSFLAVSLICNPWTRIGIPRTHSFWLQAGRAVCLVAATVASFFAYRHLPLTQATSISFASPLIVAMIAGPMLGEWPGPHRIASVVVGFVGVLIVTRPWNAGLEPAVILAFLVACANALYSITTRILAARDRPLTTLFYSGVVGCALTLPALPFVEAFPSSFSVWLAMAALGLLGALGHWLLILAHDRTTPSILAPFFYAQILGAAAFGWLIFGELPDQWTIAGGAIITASGFYLLSRERVRGVRPSADVSV